MSKLLYLFIIVLFYSCTSEIKVSEYPNKDEYKIYSLLVDSLYRVGTREMCVVIDSTIFYKSGIKTIDKDGNVKEIDELRRLSYSIPLWLKSDKEDIAKYYYAANNKKSAFVADSIHSHLQVIQISDDSLKKILLAQNSFSWNTFYKTFPKSSGVLKFSRIGFNNNYNQALVYAQYTRSGFWGAGYYVLLYKENGIWEIKGMVDCWVS